MKYQVRETRLEMWRYFYEIEASTPDEARELAELGITPEGAFVLHDDKPARLKIITRYYETEESK